MGWAAACSRTQFSDYLMRASSQNREMPIFSSRCSMWLPDGVWGNFWGLETVQCITIWPDARKCPLPFPIHAGFNRGTPHSLGNPINWKRGGSGVSVRSVRTPHSLGNPINWKPLFSRGIEAASIISPLAGEPNKLETDRMPAVTI